MDAAVKGVARPDQYIGCGAQIPKQADHLTQGLLRTKELSVEAAETVWKALRVFTSSKADFADCLIERACHDAHCEYTATFDAKAARSAGLRLIK